MAKNSKTHVCSNCIEEFDAKDIYVANKIGLGEFLYSTYYCIECLGKMKITEHSPLVKPRIKKVKEIVEKIKTPRVKKIK